MENWVENKTVLVTGGTSGLGRSIAENFLHKGAKVLAVGRKEEGMPRHENCRYYFCDFSKLVDVASLANKIREDSDRIDILVCNAGILSTSDFRKTEDDNEWSFQVNFLSHVLLKKLLFDKTGTKPDLIVNISSPIHGYGSLETDKISNEKEYKSFQAYANTKLFMALFSEKLAEEGYSSFSFNPGTFSSGIFRHQQRWFHIVYKIAAPFMTSSERVAGQLFRIIISKQWKNGEMMNKQLKSKKLKYYQADDKTIFWNWINNRIQRYLP